MLSLGDAGELSPNASVMLRIATLSAWAELAIASSHQTYLKNVVKPYRPVLSSLWVSALRDYASIRADSEVTQDDSSAALDTSYSSLGKEVLLPVCCVYYMGGAMLKCAASTIILLGQSYSKRSLHQCRTKILTFWPQWMGKTL